jgi:formylglycine-generating enzyme required for sulfatase activity
MPLLRYKIGVSLCLLAAWSGTAMAQEVVASSTPVPVELLGLGIELMPIPAGNFTMGSPVNEAGRNQDEGPARQVTITKNFWMAKYEVTQLQWQTMMGAEPSHFHGDGHRPVENVSWNDAMEFCEKLTAQEQAAGRLPAGYVYRLPTEAEWEYACRAGTTTRFYTGDKDSDLDEAGWYGANAEKTTHAVGQKKPNAWGLYDMHGDVWEWCMDWYAPYAHAAIVDPAGPREGFFRVVRGGGWLRAAGASRSASRDHHIPSYRFSNVGFRVVLAPAVVG